VKTNTLGLLLICQSLTVGVLIYGYITNHHWVGLLLIISSVYFLWFGKKKQWLLINSLVFVCQISLAIFGALVGISPFLMVAGSIGALASWELINLQENQKVSVDSPLFENYRKNRIKFLGLVIGLGLLITEFGLLIHTSLPFVFVFTITLIVLFCLYKLFIILKK